MKTVCHFYHFLSFFVVLGGGLIDFYILFVNERFEMIELKKPTTELILLFQYVGLIVLFISNFKSQGRALASLFTLDF
ncbi:hypothetical protein C6A30_01920 [Streptococcus anginosus]|nr:hypothetical protein C6A30_01920 [Streptococcus anginosus]